MQDWFAEIGAAARAFWRRDEGQDLIEHSLLLAFVALASATLYLGASKNINTLWTATNCTLTNAVTPGNQPAAH